MIISAFLLLSIFVLFLTVVALLLRDKSYQGCDLGDGFVRQQPESQVESKLSEGPKLGGIDTAP